MFNLRKRGAGLPLYIVGIFFRQSNGGPGNTLLLRPMPDFLHVKIGYTRRLDIGKMLGKGAPSAILGFFIVFCIQVAGLTLALQKLDQGFGSPRPREARRRWQ